MKSQSEKAQSELKIMKTLNLMQEVYKAFSELDSHPSMEEIENDIAEWTLSGRQRELANIIISKSLFVSSKWCLTSLFQSDHESAKGLVASLSCSMRALRLMIGEFFTIRNRSKVTDADDATINELSSIAFSIHELVQRLEKLEKL